MNKRVKYMAAVGVVGMFALAPNREWLLADGVTYTVVNQKVSDTPIKTQIEEHLVATGIPTRHGLEAEILKRYRAAIARRGFRYHNPPTNVFIYVYGTKEQAAAEQGLWIGMIAKTPSDKGQPSVQISEERLAALKRPPETRFGLSDSERRQVFREIVAAEDRGTREARARVPDSQVMQQIKLERELQTKYKADVARRRKLSNDQLRKVAVEGVTNGWPSK